MIRATTRWILTALVWMLLWPADAGSQSAALIEARDTYVALGKQKKYAEAVPFAQEAVRLAEQEYGVDSPKTAAILGALGGLYIRQRMYAEAEPHTKRALAIREKALGPKHPTVATSLSALAVLRDESECWQRFTAPSADTPTPRRCTSGRWPSAKRRWVRSTRPSRRVLVLWQRFTAPSGNRGKRPGGQAAARWRMRSGKGRMGGAPGMSSRLPR